MGIAPNLTGQIPVRAATATPPATAKSRSGRRLQRHLRRPNPSQGGGCNATCGGRIPVRAATATPPAAAESRSGLRLQRHLRRPNPGQGHDCNATCDGRTQSGRRPNPGQGCGCNATCGGRIPVRAATATPPAGAKSRSGLRLQRHLRVPNPGQGGGYNTTCGGRIPVRAAATTPPADAKSRSGRRLQRHLRRPNPGCISFDTLVFVGHVIFHHICPIVRHDNRYLVRPEQRLGI